MFFSLSSDIGNRVDKIPERGAVPHLPFEDVRAVPGRQFFGKGFGGFHADSRIAHEDASIPAREHGPRAPFGTEDAHVGCKSRVDEGGNAAGFEIGVQGIGVKNQGFALNGRDDFCPFHACEGRLCEVIRAMCAVCAFGRCMAAGRDMGILPRHPIGFDMADGHPDFARRVHGRANDLGHDARCLGGCLGPAHAHAVVGVDCRAVWAADVPAVHADQGGVFNGQGETHRLVPGRVNGQCAIVPGI